MYSAISNAVDGLTPGVGTLSLFSSADDGNHAYLRNSSLWSSANLTCIPVLSSSSGYKLGGVLVTPDILIQANHGHATGIIYFVDASNVTHSRTVVGGANIAGTDIYVARLNSPLPAGIVPAKVFQANVFPDKITSDSMLNRYVPVMFSDQHRTLRVGELVGLNSYAVVVESETEFQQWYSPVVGGDSGSAVLASVNGETVALGVWYGSNLTTLAIAPNLSNYIAQINAAITSLGSATSLAEIDLSAYPDY